MKPIIATLHKSNAARCGRHEIKSRSPITELCRALVAEGHDPETPLHCYRDDILAVTVRSIGAGAELFATETRNAPRFIKFEPFPAINGVEECLDDAQERVSGPDGTMPRAA